MKARILRLFGISSLIVTLILLVAGVLGALPGIQLGLDGAIILIMLCLASGAIIISARLVATRHPSAEKIFPSCLVAYGLVLLILNYWLQHRP